VPLIPTPAEVTAPVLGKSGAALLPDVAALLLLLLLLLLLFGPLLAYRCTVAAKNGFSEAINARPRCPWPNERNRPCHAPNQPRGR
jgi:hypothetical protein